jgi:hypothetical protein
MENRLIGPNQNHTIFVHIDKPFETKDRNYIASRFEGADLDQTGSWVIKFAEYSSIRYHEDGKTHYFYPKGVPLFKFLEYLNHVQLLGYKITKIFGMRITDEGSVVLANNYKKGFKPFYHPTVLVS